MEKGITLTAKEAETVRVTLLAAKFALEQDVDGPEKLKAIEKINEALDLIRPK